MTGSDLITQARSLLGTPHYHHGRDHNGIDCIGIILVPAHRTGLSSFEPRTYSPGEGGEYLIECLEQECILVEEGAEPGDILAFHVGGQVQHLAYLTPEGTMIHANQKAGVKESVLDDTWQERIASVWRWKALAGD